MPKGRCLSGPGLEAREEEEKKQFQEEEEEEKSGTLHAYVAATKESVQTCPTSQHTHTPGDFHAGQTYLVLQHRCRYFKGGLGKRAKVLLFCNCKYGKRGGWVIVSWRHS